MSDQQRQPAGSAIASPPVWVMNLVLKYRLHRLGAAFRAVAGYLDAAERYFGQREAKAVDRDHPASMAAPIAVAVLVELVKA